MTGKKKEEADEATGGVKVRFKTNVPNHTRELSKADFDRAGIDHKKISVSTGEVIEVSSEAADFLVDDLGEFERVDDEAATEKAEPATDLQDTVPDGADEQTAGGGGTQTGANVRDGAGARSATINR